jgi:hypothetical protein
LSAALSIPAAQYSPIIGSPVTESFLEAANFASSDKVPIKTLGFCVEFQAAKNISELEELELTETSSGSFKIPNVGSGVGPKTYEGAIMIKKKSGKVRWYPFEETYTVAGKGSCVVSA